MITRHPGDIVAPYDARFTTAVTTGCANVEHANAPANRRAAKELFIISIVLFAEHFPEECLDG